MPASTTFTVQPTNQGASSTFKAYYLRNAFYKGYRCHSGSLMELGKLKGFWKQFTILDTSVVHWMR